MRTTFPLLRAVAVLAGVLVASGPLRAEPSGTPSTHGPNADELANAEAEFAQMSAAEGAAKAFDAYMVDDAILPGPAPTDPADKANLLTDLRTADAAGAKLTWHCLRVETASSGDFGYTYGAWEERTKDGKLVTQGKYATVWKKLDGKWKAIFDLGNHT